MLFVSECCKGSQLHVHLFLESRTQGVPLTMEF